MLLEVDRISKIYHKDWVALSEVSLTLDEAEFVFLTGASGAGKTTLLRLLYLEEWPDLGEIRFQEYSSNTIEDEAIPFMRRKLGIVFQDYKLLPDLTAYENVEFALRVTGCPRKRRREQAYELLSKVGLTHKKHSYPYELSGGEKQRVGLARALALDPYLLLADEPTGNLDPQNTKEITDLVVDINKQGTAVIFATHDEKLVQDYPFKKLTLQEGILVEQ